MKSLITTILLTFFCVNAHAQQRPNVLFIIVDDLNDMPLHSEGKPHVPTPNFDRLAARGVSFTNAHCNDPICAPSRSSLLTARSTTAARIPTASIPAKASAGTSVRGHGMDARKLKAGSYRIRGRCTSMPMMLTRTWTTDGSTRLVR